MSRFASEEFWLGRGTEVLLPPHSALSAAEISAALAGQEAVVFQTSGSSGTPRLVCHSRNGLLASARAVNAHLDARSDDVWLAALPAYHVGGLGVFARAMCSKSMVCEYSESWDARRFAEACAACRATLTSLVPTQIFDLLEARCRCPQPLRAVLVGGGHLEAPIEAEARQLGWPVLRTYGLTEAGSQVATQRGDELLVLPHLQAALGAGGRLKLRGESMASGCLVADRSGGWRFEPCLDVDGWLQTDDLVELDGGTLRFIGRASSRVKVLGELVDLEALERLFLQAVPARRELALVDVPDPRSGNALLLAFDAAVDREELRPWVQTFNAAVAGFERITGWVEVAAIPRGSLGKVRRNQLRERVVERGGIEALPRPSAGG